MATQGLVTVMQGRKVLMKIVAGCEGMNAQNVAQAIRGNWPATPKEAYKIAVQEQFGCEDDLVVITPDFIEFKGDADIDPVAYRKKFNQPRFNPRWPQGTTAYTEIVAV